MSEERTSTPGQSPVPNQPGRDGKPLDPPKPDRQREHKVEVGVWGRGKRQLAGFMEKGLGQAFGKKNVKKSK